jgi:tRNA G26 N,N-dimethylase Trm1
MGGPIWTPPMHNRDVLKKALVHLDDEKHAALYNTSKRIYGLVTVMNEVSNSAM